MFASASNKPDEWGALPVEAEGNNFRLFLMVEKSNFRSSDVAFSSWYTFKGYLWRIMVNPYGRTEKQWASAFLECGGPDLTRAGPVSSSKRRPPTWRVPVRVYLTLLHPSKWSSLGISKDNTCGIFPSDAVIPCFPRDHTKFFFTTFNNTDSRGYGLFTFARAGMIQPGLFADDDFNFAVVIQAFMYDYFDSPSGITGITEVCNNPENKAGHIEENSFDTALEERTTLIEKLVEYDVLLVSSKQTSVRLLLEKEIMNISDALEILPDLHTFSSQVSCLEEAHDPNVPVSLGHDNIRNQAAPS